MMKTHLTQSEKRKTESLNHQFNTPSFSEEILIIKSSSDVGVTRNFGRNGAKYGPEALINSLKKMATHPPISELKLTPIEVANEEAEKIDFNKAQALEAQEILKIIQNKNKSSLIHLGGGHDHVYPLLKAISKKFQFKELIVLNVDAHADTRDEDEGHSGTPFRQFSNEFDGKFKLYQIGLNRFANSKSTLNPLKNHEMNILWREDLENLETFHQFFKSIKPGPDTLVVFSLDADVLNGFEVPSVSAVNPKGISLNQLQDIYDEYLKLLMNQKPIIGIYELNPVFDTLSGIGVRTLATFLYHCLLRQ